MESFIYKPNARCHAGKEIKSIDESKHWSFLMNICNSFMKIADFPLQNRPIERLEKFGVSALSDAELLAIILRTGSAGENVVDLSNRLLSTFCIEKLVDCSLVELQEIKGVGKSKASQILAIFELAKRYYSVKNKVIRINSASDVFALMQPKKIIGTKNVQLLDIKSFCLSIF